MSRIFAIAIMIISFFITGCNMMEGLGKDIRKGGEKIEDTADDAQN